MKAFALVAFLVLPISALAGGGGGPDCSSDVIAQCQTKDGNSLVDIIEYSCEDGAGNFWPEFALALNLPDASARVYLGITDTENPYDVSSKRSGDSYQWTEGRSVQMKVNVEYKISRMRGDIEIKAEEDGRTLVNASLICRQP